MYCPDCEQTVSRKAVACPHCGCPLQGRIESIPAQPVQVVVNQPQLSKSRALYIILALLFGLAGIHNFYARYIGTGLIQLIISLTGIGCIITVPWVILDILFTTKDGRGIYFD